MRFDCRPSAEPGPLSGAAKVSGEPFSGSAPGLQSEDATLDAVPRRPSHRERILDAAEAVVRDAGAVHLTLDAAAERAGVSKGGLLYHFKTKEALLQAMIDRHMLSLGARHAAALASLPPGPGRELKAWVLVAISNEKTAADKRMSCSMLAAAANDPRLTEPFHQFQQRRLRTVQEAAAAGLPFARAAAVILALDGVGMLELHQLSPYDTTQRRAILEDILRLIDETVAAVAPAQSPA